MVKKNRIFGAPGTGKTTYLLNLIKQLHEVDKVPLENICFISFLNSTIDELKSRLTHKLDSDKQFRYFRTIHSLCNQNKIDNRKVLTKEYYKYFDVLDPQKIEKYFFYYGLQRENIKTFEEIVDYDAGEYEIFVEQVEQIKKQYNLLDFTDMIKDFNSYIDIDFLFVDEAQDISYQQFLVIEKLIKNCREEVFIALDPAQSIFDWSGASVDYLLQQKDYNDIVLPITYRLPKIIFETSQRILTDLNITIYQNIKLQNQKQGNIESIKTLEEIDFLPDETYMLLVRNNYQYKKYISWARKNNFQILIEGNPIYSLKDIENVYNIYKKTGKNTHSVSLEDYEYILDNYLLSTQPKINITTIHKAKGQEAKNVILINSITKTQEKELLEDNSSEKKVLYVAMTRCKENLWIVNEKGTKYNIEEYL